MNYPIYFIHIDILGFEKRAKLIAEEKAISERNVRIIFKHVVKERLKLIKETYDNCDYVEHSTDSWMITFKSDQKSNPVYESFHIISILETNNLGFNIINDKIGFDIAIGLIDFHRIVSVEFKYLELEPETIALMKQDLCLWYHKCSKIPIQETFVAITELVYDSLNFHNQSYCTEIKYQDKPVFHIFGTQRIIEIGKTIEFTKQISLHHEIYKEIDWIFVQPQNFQEIKNLLKIKRLIIISGQPQYGKTFTSIRLLWEFSKEGYSTMFISNEQFEKDELREIGPIRNPLIIYIEDPLGSEIYKNNYYSEQKLKDIINNILKYENSYLIITMNLNVIQEYMKKKTLDIHEINDESIILISMNSYPIDQRESLIKNYTKKERCSWYKDSDILIQILEYVKNKDLLYTPFSIARFAKNTKSETALEILKREAESITTDIIKYLSSIFCNYSEQHILLMVLLSSSYYYKLKLFQEIYEDIEIKLISGSPFNFEQILQDLIENDYITTTSNQIFFTHVSYLSAVRHLIDNEIKDRRFKDYLINIINYLLLSEDLQVHVSFTIYMYFKFLPIELINKVILKLSKNIEPTYNLGMILKHHYDSIDSSIIFEVIEEAIKRENCIRDMVKLIIDHYNDMPDNLKDRLNHIACDKELNIYVIEALGVIPFAKKLPKKVRIELIESIINTEENLSALLGILTLHYSYKEFREDYLPIIVNIFESNPQLLESSYNIFFKYGNFDEAFRNEYVRLIKKYPNFGITILKTIYDRIAEFRSSVIYLLIRLVDSEELLGYILIILKEYFDIIEEPFREHLITKLYESNPDNDHVKNLILNFYDRLSLELREKLDLR